MKDLIACCGLDCEKCNARIATLSDDDTLREKTAQLWSEINHVPITKEMINCTGCRTDGAKTPFCDSMCGIRKCAVKRNFETCAECTDKESCGVLAMVRDNNPEAGKNLGI